MTKSPRALVIEAQLQLIFAMIRAEYDPLSVASAAREALYDGFAWVLTEDEKASIFGVLYGMGGGASWNRYTQDNRAFFETHLLNEMERLIKEIDDAVRAVRKRVFAALDDPANWPFDPDLSPEHETNVEAAKAHDVTYNPSLRQYVDEDGCPRFDEYGQPL